MDIRFDVPQQFFLKGIPCRVDLHPGQKLGEYTVVEFKGGGTFGSVFHVKKDNRDFALKLLKLWEVVYKDQKEAIGERFLREYHAATTKSEYLVHSHAYGEIDNNPFFIMDFARNGDVRERMPKLTHDEIVMIGYDVLKGLRDLHQVGIIHRDIKPENVLLADNGKALLTDFGISAFVNHKIKRGTKPNMFGNVKETFGTYAYIAPEQLVDGKKFATTTPRTDIWSWGVMMYEMFSRGEYPFGPLETESDLVDFIQNSREGRIVHTSAFASMPPGWPEIVKACIQARFDNRIESIDHILNRLDKSNMVREMNTLSVSGSITLKVLQGVQPGKTFTLQPTHKIFNLGRSERNEIQIEDYQTVFISRNHATIECVPSLNGWFIKDGQWDDAERCWKTSTNGTWVNSSQIDAKPGVKLRDGDIITIGDTTIKVEGSQTNHK